MLRRKKPSGRDNKIVPGVPMIICFFARHIIVDMYCQCSTISSPWVPASPSAHSKLSSDRSNDGRIPTHAQPVLPCQPMSRYTPHPLTKNLKYKARYASLVAPSSCPPEEQCSGGGAPFSLWLPRGYHAAPRQPLISS